MRKTRLLFLIFIIFFLCSGVSFSAPPKKGAVKKPIPKTSEEAPAPVEAEKPRYKSRSEIKYTGFDAKRDPFSPPLEIVKMLEKPEQIPGAETVAKDIKLPKVDLQGIIWSKRTPQVIINGAVMSVGEFIEEFEIKEIRQTGIILFYKGNDYFIKMLGYARPNKTRKKR